MAKLQSTNLKFIFVGDLRKLPPVEAETYGRAHYVVKMIKSVHKLALPMYAF